MKKMKNILFLFTLIFFTVISIVSCKKDDVVPIIPNDTTHVSLSGEINKDIKLTSDKKYTLYGFVYVTDGTTLTIEPGTIITGDKITIGTLIIEPGAKIIAEGTAQNPIIFTSNGPSGYRNRGDWGGVILCGRAPANSNNPQIEGGPRTHYGGNISNDNSGILKYVRIEYAGYPFQPDKEINGLTLAGVGNGTVIDYIQVSFSNDDSFEWFGGTVNAKHLISYRGLDDDFDTDNGFSGLLQYIVAIRDKNVADISGSNGFESDNDASGSDNIPYTDSKFSNVTIIGPKNVIGTTSNTMNTNYKNALHLRRNTKLKIYNSIFIGYPGGLLLDGTKCENNALLGDLQLKNCIISNSDNNKYFNVSNSNTWSIQQLSDWYFTTIYKNDTLSPDKLKFDVPIDFNNNFNLLPNSSSLIFGKSSYDGLDTFFNRENFIGAFGNTDWTIGWTNFDPQNTNY